MKFIVDVPKKVLDDFREIMNTDWGMDIKKDEDVIKELFFLNETYSDTDHRKAVKVKKETKR